MLWTGKETPLPHRPVGALSMDSNDFTAIVSICYEENAYFSWFTLPFMQTFYAKVAVKQVQDLHACDLGQQLFLLFEHLLGIPNKTSKLPRQMHLSEFNNSINTL